MAGKKTKGADVKTDFSDLKQTLYQRLIACCDETLTFEHQAQVEGLFAVTINYPKPNSNVVFVNINYIFQHSDVRQQDLISQATPHIKHEPTDNSAGVSVSCMDVCLLMIKA